MSKAPETATGQQGLAPREVRRLLTMWLAGVGLALIPVAYGAYCLVSGHTILPGDTGPMGGGPDLNVYGPAAVALAIAYIALGVLGHLHWFWGSYPRLSFPCAVLKVVILLVFVGTLSFAICRILTSGL